MAIVFRPIIRHKNSENHTPAALQRAINNSQLKKHRQSLVYQYSGNEVLEMGAHRKGMLEELEKAHIYIEQLHRRMNEMEARLQQLVK